MSEPLFGSNTNNLGVLHTMAGTTTRMLRERMEVQFTMHVPREQAAMVAEHLTELPPHWLRRLASKLRGIDRAAETSTPEPPEWLLVKVVVTAVAMIPGSADGQSIEGEVKHLSYMKHRYDPAGFTTVTDYNFFGGVGYTQLYRPSTDEEFGELFGLPNGDEQ